MKQTHLAGHLFSKLADVCDITKGRSALKLIGISNPTPLCCGASPTLRVSYLNVGRWAAEGHSDLLETGVKGQLPNVADAAGVISRQQVDL